MQTLYSIQGSLLKNQFRYRSLDSYNEPLRVRLVELLEPIPGGRVRLTMVEDVDLCEYEYSALSYEWGEKTLSDEVEVNGSKMSVQRNLYLFLQTLNHKSYARLWVDAICIDQTNPRERTHQVSRMGEIYARASRVLAWLGPSCTRDEARFIQMCNSESTYTDRNKEHIRHEDEISSILKQLCQRRYWSRLWILQELLLNADVMLFCGVDDMRLGSFLVSCSVYNPVLLETEATSHFARFFDYYRKHTKSSRNTCLLYVIQYFASAKCKLLHDKVYGLLGLAHSGLPRTIDYDLPIESVFLDILESATPYSALGGCFELAKALRIRTTLHIKNHQLQIHLKGSAILVVTSHDLPNTVLFRVRTLREGSESDLRRVIGLHIRPTSVVKSIAVCLCSTCFTSFRRKLRLGTVSERPALCLCSQRDSISHVFYQVVPDLDASIHERSHSDIWILYCNDR